jgi:hypothetical protein
MLRVIAYQNSSGEEEYNITKGGVDFNLNAAGVTKIEVVENGKSIDSDGDHVSFSGSRIKVAWGKLNAQGNSNPTIWAYSPSYPTGEVIVGPGKADSVVLSMMPDERPLT